MAKKKAEAAAPILTYKGFDLDWSCRGFKYEVGGFYEHDGRVKACEQGFHACEYPLHVLRYYPASRSRFAVVEQSGTLARHDEDSKIASSHLTVKAEIDLAGLIKAAIKYTMDRCTPADGAVSDTANTVVKADGRSKSATASGNYGAATASGDSGAATASGKNSTACAPGRNGRAQGIDGTALFLTRRDVNWNITHAWAGIVGRDGIKADTFYSLDESGKPCEVA